MSENGHARARSELTIPAADGLPLAATFRDGPATRAAVLVAHGFGEHRGRYDELAESLADCSVLTYDQRGHGGSPGPRGVLRNYGELVDDHRHVLGWLRSRRPDLPIFLLGHSNGGLITLLTALAEGPGHLAGLVISNPLLRLRLPVPRLRRALGAVLRLFPRVTLSTPLIPEQLTRDPERQRSHREDPLAHTRINAPFYFGMVDGGAEALQRLPEIRTPAFMILGGADPIVDADTSRGAFPRIGAEDKALLFEPEMVHEPFHDLGRDRIIAAVDRWIGDHSPHSPRGELDSPLSTRQNATDGQADG